MSTFRSIEELVKSLDREKELLKEMFAKRKSLSFRYDYALEMTDYKEERIRYLIDYGVIRDTGDFLEMEDIYLKFFEDILEVNEEINVSYVQDYLVRLNENIDYYLKENNEKRKYNYQREVKRCLKNIALTTVRNVLDLKRNMDNTYKNEPNYQIKKAKLTRLSEKLRNISLLITKCEELIDHQQPVFFRIAMDVQMQNVVSDVKLQLNDSYHNLLEIHRQIVHYLNLIDYQNRIFEKIRKLKYLKDQFLLEENTNIRQVLSGRNPVWMKPQINYRIKLSVDALRTSDEAFQIIRKLAARQKIRKNTLKNLAAPIPEGYLDGQSEVVDMVNLQEVYNAFEASGAHLFYFVMNYRYCKDVTSEDKLIYFCQLASQYADKLNFTECYEHSGEVEYPIIYPK
ncbi:hypothetical protein [Bacteroides fragilis]|uniref:hypothetical protein n=1 Tax=Bacteroides fragilis TaxID=817 RepID=UPI0020305248|nr:hypothetical protein [Bacteroides fragilis]MCM0219587.1 hypothetical protein [Bacteroides fragilis]MCM0268872.1 hypothetical protein [Bacteroides fragilis]